ncbi:MAG: hypothetical protein ACTSW1_17345, partial [Candidatus Hodarchaeales archaeon]
MKTYEKGNSFPKNQTILHQQLKDMYCEKLGGIQEASLKIGEMSYRIDVYNENKDILCEIQRNSLGGRFSDKIKNIIQTTKSKVIIVIPVATKQKITRKDKDIIINVSYVQQKLGVFALFNELVRVKFKFIEGRMELHILLSKEHLIKQRIKSKYHSRRNRYKAVQR